MTIDSAALFVEYTGSDNQPSNIPYLHITEEMYIYTLFPRSSSVVHTFCMKVYVGNFYRANYQIIKSSNLVRKA